MSSHKQPLPEPADVPLDVQVHRALGLTARWEICQKYSDEPGWYLFGIEPAKYNPQPAKGLYTDSMTMVLRLLMKLACLAHAKFSIRGRGKHPDHWWDIEISAPPHGTGTLSDKDLGVAACQAVLMMQRIIKEMEESGYILGALPPD